jgi:hypothetical protein
VSILTLLITRVVRTVIFISDIRRWFYWPHRSIIYPTLPSDEVLPCGEVILPLRVGKEPLFALPFF